MSTTTLSRTDRGDGTIMARRGRLRRQGTRFPAGKLKPETEADIRAVVMAQPHRRGLPVIYDSSGRIVTDKRLDQKAEDFLGNLSLINAITDQEYAAGQRFRAVTAAYRAVISSPDPLLRPTPGSGAGLSDDEAARRTEAYEDAMRVLDLGEHAADMGLPRWLPALVTIHIVVDNMPMRAGELRALRCGLQALARHWGMG